MLAPDVLTAVVPASVVLDPELLASPVLSPPVLSPAVPPEVLVGLSAVVGELAVTTDGRLFDLAKREADIAIRALPIGVQPAEHLIGLEVAPVMLANYVASEHASRLDPEIDGTSSRWIAFDQRKQFEGMIARSSYPRVPAWGAFASVEVVVQAAREGLGLAMLPTYVGDREAALRRMTRPDLRHVADLWLLSHPDLRDNARFRATRASVAQAFKTHAPLFRGDGWRIGAPGCP